MSKSDPAASAELFAANLRQAIMRELTEIADYCAFMIPRIQDPEARESLRRLCELTQEIAKEHQLCTDLTFTARERNCVPQITVEAKA